MPGRLTHMEDGPPKIGLMAGPPFVVIIWGHQMAGPEAEVGLRKPLFKNQNFFTLAPTPAVVAINLHQRVR